jgi:pyrimidine-nucleoside phosphorylase
MVASAGVPVAKMSGRGLGHTGGTLDKLEAIEGFKVQLSMEEFVQNVNRIKLAVCGQTGDVVPADKKLYALRDVTGTVDNISLIAGSIMSKKIASGADAIVLDVKTGSGAFMKSTEDAFFLAKEMVNIGSSLNKNVTALITEMNEPLGYAVGNALEVKEAIDTLMGKGPKDLQELCIELGSIMLLLGKKAESLEQAREILIDKINSGEALQKLVEMVEAQHGNKEQIINPELLPKAMHIIEVKSENSGYVERIDAESIGIAALILGAGRETKEAGIDYAVGIILNKKVGEYVASGDILARIHANDLSKVAECTKKLLEAYSYTEGKPEARPLIFGMVDKNGIKKYI